MAVTDLGDGRKKNKKKKEKKTTSVAQVAVLGSSVIQCPFMMRC
jgi:hypothetical protein